MCEDPDEELAGSACEGASGQGFTHVPLESGEDALALPALTVDPPGKAVLHEASVSAGRFGPEPAARVDRDRGGADSELLATQVMEVLRVVAGVGKHSLDSEIARSLADDRFEAYGIMGCTRTDSCTTDKMRGVVGSHRQLDESPQTGGSLALAPQEIAAGVMALQTGGVNGYVRLGRCQATSAGTVEYSAEQALESPFFSSRCSAFWSVV